MLGTTVAVPESAVNDLAYTALEQGKVKEAIVLFQDNVDANPNSPNAYDGLADGLLKDGQFAAAKRASERSVELARQWQDSNLTHFEQQVKRIDQRMKEQEKGKK
jgi:predicted Zn-dependent protease